MSDTCQPRGHHSGELRSCTDQVAASIGCHIKTKYEQPQQLVSSSVKLDDNITIRQRRVLTEATEPTASHAASEVAAPGSEFADAVQSTVDDPSLLIRVDDTGMEPDEQTAQTQLIECGRVHARQGGESC